MKWLILITFGALLGAITATAALADTVIVDDNHKFDNLDNQADIDDNVTYQAIDGKAYKVVDGLISNEWVPLTTGGYIDDYDQSAKAKEIKAANAGLKRIKG